MRGRTILAVLALVAGCSALIAPPARAGVVINVPDQRPTIQAGIDAASIGDTVLVAPGTYFENIDFKGKAIEVRGSQVETPVIDGGGTSHVVVFKSGETRASVLRGFRITHGTVPADVSAGLIAGAGIGILDASPTIIDNQIVGNNAGGHSGGGIAALGGSPLIRDNLIQGNTGAPGGGIMAGGGAEITGNGIISNTAQGGGGGIFVYGGDPFVHHNLLDGNQVTGVGSDGGGLRTEAGGRFVNNVIVQNTAAGSGGGVSWEGISPGMPYVLNNTVMDNQAPNGSAVAGLAGGAQLVNNVLTAPAGISAVWCSASAAPATVFSHNDVHNGGPSPYAGCANATGTTGNISSNPFPNSTWSPTSPESPVVDAGTNGATSLPATDVMGNPRVADGDGDGVAVVDMGAEELPAFVPPVGDRYHPLPPARLLDTRLAIGAPAAKLGPGASLDLQATGRGGVPAGGVSAVVLNVTVTNPTASSWLTAWPSGTTLPVASNLNYVAGQTVANLVVVEVGAGGKISLYNSAGSTDVVADVAGWYGGVAGGSGYFPTDPSRILDTRVGMGAPVAKVAAGGTLPLQITGQGGVPSSGVTAVVLNVTVTGTTSGGYLTAWPAGQAQPHTSILNFDAGGTVPNLVIVKVGTGGQINLFNSAGSTDIVVDVEGWFGADGAPGGGRFTSVAPTRVLDTRTGQLGNHWVPPTRLAADGTLQLGVPGLPQTGVSAVVLNVTVTGPASEGWLTIWSSNGPRPVASNLNYVAGQTVPNLVMVPVDDGWINVYSSGGPVDVIADLAGWYGTT